MFNRIIAAASLFVIFVPVISQAKDTPCGEGSCPIGACFDFGGHKECIRGYVPEPDVAMSSRRDYTIIIKDADPKTVTKVKELIQERLPAK